jgi:transposase-like protein
MESFCLLCPFCGQENQLEVDTSIGAQRFVTDCEVCCRPFEVVAACERGELVNVEALAN